MIITECHTLPTREDTGSGQGQRSPGQCDVSYDAQQQGGGIGLEGRHKAWQVGAGGRGTSSTAKVEEPVKEEPDQV